jgi:hypothetical protein
LVTKKQLKQADRDKKLMDKRANDLEKSLNKRLKKDFKNVKAKKIGEDLHEIVFN